MSVGRYRSAGRALQHWLRLTERHGSLVRVFTGGAALIEQQHYPPADLRDPASGTQCYYHCHRGDGEHGHLHLFRRSRPDRPLTHLIGISLDGRGLPLALFSVNRWVTGDRWLPAAATLRLLDGVSLAGAGTDPHLGGWLSHFLRFYGPTLEIVLMERDRHLAASGLPGALALEDRTLEIPSHRAIDWAADLEAAEERRPSAGQAEARPQPHPQGRAQKSEHDPQPAVETRGGDACQVGAHVAAEREPGPIAHQQPTQEGGACGPA